MQFNVVFMYEFIDYNLEQMYEFMIIMIVYDDV